MKISIGVLVCLCSYASADVASDFTETKLVPDSYESAPNDYLEISFEGKPVPFGEERFPYDVRDPPALTWSADPDKYYTIMHLTPDFPLPKRPKWRNFLMWLVVNVPGSDVSQGKTLSEYTGCAPVKDAGKYRCAFTVHEQPGKLDVEGEVYSGDRKLGNRLKWKPHDFMDKYKLSPPLWGTMYVSEYDDYGDEVMREFLAGHRFHEHDHDHDH